PSHAAPPFQTAQAADLPQGIPELTTSIEHQAYVQTPPHDVEPGLVAPASIGCGLVELAEQRSDLGQGHADDVAKAAAVAQHLLAKSPRLGAHHLVVTGILGRGLAGEELKDAAREIEVVSSTEVVPKMTMPRIAAAET